MADLESALSELGAGLTATDRSLSTSLAEILTGAIQDLIEAELTARIGAEPGERTPLRTAQRNGHRPKLLSTPGGDVEVGIPKLRTRSFFPELLEPRRRIDRALWAVIMTAYITGTSTRKVDDLVKALGCDTGISKSSVSRICKAIDGDVAVLRQRRLDHQPFVYVWFDATYVHVRESHQVVSKAVVIATGLRADGHREVLGVDVGDSENETFWTEFLRDLKDRGLDGTRLVISDAHAGLRAAIRRVLQGAAWQRCRVHAMRNLLSAARHQHRQVIAALIRTIFVQPDAETASTQLRSVVDQLKPFAPDVAERLEKMEADLLAYATFPPAHWSKIWSNNPIERLNRELKRRTDVVGIFPNTESVIRLVGALLVEINDEMIEAYVPGWDKVQWSNIGSGWAGTLGQPCPSTTDTWPYPGPYPGVANSTTDPNASDVPLGFGSHIRQAVAPQADTEHRLCNVLHTSYFNEPNTPSDQWAGAVAVDALLTNEFGHVFIERWT